MTTLMSNPSGGGGRKPSTNKDRKAIHPNKNDRTSSSNVVSSSSSTVNTSESTITNNNQVAEEFKTNNKTDKFQPTAEQMRIASLMSDKKDDDLKPKIEKIVELTGASRDDAAVALYDCDNDMPKAIEMILDGESFDSEWQSTGRKKKTKSQGNNQINDVITNGNKSTEKSARSNNKNNASLGTGVERSSGGSERGQAKSSRGGGTTGAGKNNRKKDFRANNNQNETVNKNFADGEENDSFANTNNAETVNKKFGSKRDGAPRGRGRGATRGRGMARGSRTFMNRGIQNSHHSNNNNSNSDGFPNSIETWTNNAVETVPKTANNDLNTMTVGNWSDVAANEEWSEEDWTSAPMETKVFTPSTKVIPEKEETKEQPSNKQLNHNPNESQVYMPSSVNKAEEPSQPTMSAIISNNIKRPSQPTTAGQALLQQIQLTQQQSQSVSQNSSLNQYNMSQYSKQATQSIKNLVGITQNLNISNDHSLENLSKTASQQQQQQQQQQPSNQNRIKVQNISSKIPETAVEMPSNDPITNLSLHFSGLEFGFQVNAPKKQPDNKPMPLSTNATVNDATYPTNPNQSSGNANTKNLLQGQVLPHQLNDSLLNNDHRNDKSLNPSSYTSNKPTMVVDRKSDYNSMNYKSTYPPLNENVYSSGYQPQQQQQQQQPPQSSINAGTVSYYSTTNNVNNQVPFGTTNAANNNPAVNLMGNSNIYNPNVGVYSTNNNVVNASKGIRDLDNNANSVQQTPQSASSTAVVSNKTPYETSSNVGTSLSQMSSSTSTTNAIKNTLSSTGKTGMHNMPPGVTNSLQPTQVITSPYLMSNPTMPIQYYSFDMSFPATAHTRDPNYATSYAPAEVKYNRNSESDMLPVSSQTASAAQTATQAHTPYYNHFPANYFLSYNFPNYYGNPPPPIYPVAAQAQNQASTTSAFKPNQAANYGSHSYNSGYDSMGTTVPQTQDYVNKPYQHAKQIAGTGTAADMTTNPQNMYNKAHPQLNKNYDKQGFQAQAPPINLANPAQPAANMSSAYNNTYMLPHHQQPMHHSFTNAEPTQQTTAGANQRNIMHKNISSNTGTTYAKFSWN